MDSAKTVLALPGQQKTSVAEISSNEPPSSMVKSELQWTNNILELLENMNLKVGEEYKGFGDVASWLRVFVEQFKNKSGEFDEYVEQIDAIEQQVTVFEAVILVLHRYVSLLESKLQSIYQHPPP